MFLRASELNQHSKRITTGKGVTSSVSCAIKYFEEDEGTGSKQLSFFWLNAARRYDRLGIMEWACQQGYSAVWGVSYIGPCICHSAARYGQLQALQWLRENECPWNCDTCHAAAEGGHLSCLKWARENGCPED